MDMHPLTKKSADHRNCEAEICFERKRKRRDRIKPFKSNFNLLSFKPFNKFLEQDSGLLGERIINNEHSFLWQMKSSEISLSNTKTISLPSLLLTKKKAPDKSGALQLSEVAYNYASTSCSTPTAILYKTVTSRNPVAQIPRVMPISLAVG